ncbi:hypothetical protein EYF80_013793 [Liparis tanakae]|uniref:Uncharacterized protein n=1 Tax=Liparis tanakae TaxID=230148 RepID=A0A4Z2IDI5_9TELE|nr:hypothetical protein EYF80_013793 [Liparis tanakae]
MEQRKAWASGWQPVCSRGLHSSDRGTTSASRLLWPKKLGSRISEYPTSLQTLICCGMVTQRVDWLMSNAAVWLVSNAMVRRAAVRSTAMPRESTSKVSQPHQPVSLLSTTYQRRRDDGDNGLFCDDCRRGEGGRAGWGLSPHESEVSIPPSLPRSLWSQTCQNKPNSSRPCSYSWAWVPAPSAAEIASMQPGRSPANFYGPI